MKGLLFTPQMARAVCAGSKTQTRRLGGLAAVNDGPDEWTPCADALHEPDGALLFKRAAMANAKAKPGRRVGERVCLLTTWAAPPAFDNTKPSKIIERFLTPVGKKTPTSFWHAGMGVRKPDWCGKSRPGRFLPNHLRELMPLLEITGVKCERLQDISEQDVTAEGCTRYFRPDGCGYGAAALIDTRDYFCALWDSIHRQAGHGWERNEWVFVYTFKLVKP